MKKLSCFLLFAFFGLLLSGCDARNGHQFAGHWVEVNGIGTEPMTLDIVVVDQVFHVDERKELFGKIFERSLEGVAVSNTTLSLLGGALSMRLKNNSLIYSGRTLVKSQ